MICTEEQYIAYFQNLAHNHNQINDGLDGNSAFFYIPVSYDLAEIDNAIKNTMSDPMMALDSLKGRFDDAVSESHTQWIDGQFIILVKSTSGDKKSVRPAMATALQIGGDILFRMQNDAKRRLLISPNYRFTIRNVNYSPVGPMCLLYYGYAFTYSISCPFGFNVTSATWLDK